MEKIIINRVENSGLICLDLKDYLPKKDSFVSFDLKNFLFNDLVLKEKLFRKLLKEYDFSYCHNKVVGVFCSGTVIIPMWAYMLVTTYLNGISQEVYFGEKNIVFTKFALKKIDTLDVNEFKDKRVIIKGCGGAEINEQLYMEITKKLHPFVSSLMFGEACSTVPIFKKPKKQI